MSGRRTRGLISLALAAAVTTATYGVAVAHPTAESDGGITDEDAARDLHQHGDTAGHLPASNSNVEVVSKLLLKNAAAENVADVSIYKNHAYLAKWGAVNCDKNGVNVVDISDVSNPREVSFIVAKRGSYPGEGVQALSISTPDFTGDVLVTNNEKCDDTTGFGGLNLYDVTNPRTPTPLAEGIGDFTVNGQGKRDANQIHSVFAWDAGDRAYAVMVDNEEYADVDIMDITNPRKPFLTAEYDLAETFPQILQAAPENLKEVFLHDMVVKEVGGRQVMLLSYWDGGYVKMDVTDVQKPVYLGDTDFASTDPEAAESGYTVPPEGNAHQAEFTADDKYVIGADEDFGPYALTARNTTDGTSIDASQGSDTPKLESGQTITGQARYVGRACNGDALVPAATGDQIAVVERGVCAFTEKITNVQNKGYEAALVFNRQGAGGCETPLSMSVAGTIPTFGVAPRSQGYAIFGITYNEAQCLAASDAETAPIAVGALGDELTFSSYFDGWGYVHLFRNENGKMRDLDTYAIPEAHDPKYASGYGDLSVHEVATSPTRSNLMYFSYYSGGLRVVAIEKNRLVEKGHFIAAGGSNLWGVEVFSSKGQEYVAASDRDHGLWIFKYNG